MIPVRSRILLISAAAALAAVAALVALLAGPGDSAPGPSVSDLGSAPPAEATAKSTAPETPSGPEEIVIVSSTGPDDSLGIAIRLAWPSQGKTVLADIYGAEWQRLLAGERRSSRILLRECDLQGRKCSFPESASVEFAAPPTDRVGASLQGEVSFSAKGASARTIPFSAEIQNGRIF